MKKRILSLTLLVLLFSLTISQAFGEIDNHLLLEGLTIIVEAPSEAKGNEEFNVNLEIYPLGEIYVKYLVITFGSSSNPIYEETLFYQQNISGEFSKTYVLKTKNYGQVPCTINVYYVVGKGTLFEKSCGETFELDLTYVTDKTREELKNDYDRLSWNYTWLKSGYESLKSNYEKLERDYSSLSEELQEQNKMTDIFLLTTAVFLASTIYLAWKIRRKEQGKQKSK